MQLNGESVQKAWEDYKGFLESMGGSFEDDRNKVLLQQIQAAYKMGFAYGQQIEKEEARPIKVFPGVEITPQQGEQVRLKHKIVKRTEKQIQQDARLVASILQRHGGPMYLREITVAVNAAGGKWYEKSASGHMNMVMSIYPTIKKLRRGVYEYGQ